MMKRLFFTAFCVLDTLLFYNSCCRPDKNYIFPYCELHDSLELFISKAPEFPKNTPSFVCVIFHADSLKEKEDTIVVLMKGNAPFSPVNGQFVVGATYFDKHICEVVFDGFEHLPGIVNEDVLTLNTDEYIKYGFNKEIYDDPQYQEWCYSTRALHKKEHMTRTYRIKRPNTLERI